MPKPHKTTVDQLINLFDSWDTDTQERVLDQLELVQRLAKRRASSAVQPPAPKDPPPPPGGVN